MSSHVVLITDAHEAPAYELIEALRGAGVKTLIEGLREVEIEVELARKRENAADPAETLGPPPLAVLYEVVPGADMVELHTAVEHAKAFWPGAPLVACRRHVNGYQSHNLRSLDGAALKRLGFRAIADKAAQLPAILREIDGQGATGELRMPELVQRPSEPGSLSLPAKMKAADLRAAFDLVSSLHFIADQSSAAQTALAGLAPIVEADRWVVYLINEGDSGEGINLEAIAVKKRGEETPKQNEDDWRRILTGESVLPAGSESKAARFAAAGLGLTKRTEQGHRVVAVPLICGERLLGVMEGMREGETARAFSKNEVALLNALAHPIASALANAVRIAEAERLSQTDDLTKLHNARYLRQFLLNEIRRARRYGSSVAALFLDLDDFKQINDIHGHLVGSHVLMEMAAVILSSVRDTDAVARYGGDEFVIVLPDTGTELAGTVAERIRSKIKRYEFTGGRRLKLSLTASFGVAAFPQHASSPQQLIACADTAMYEAKAANKNCVKFAAGLAQARAEKQTVETETDQSLSQASQQ
jgi:diguanylate cyclase (GGDEF)-like protein